MSKRLMAFVFVALQILNNLSFAAAQSCKNLFQSETECNLPDCKSNRIFDFFSKKTHNIPIKYKFKHKKASTEDLQLLLNSYYYADYDGPVEYGLVELIDRNGNVIDSSGEIRGDRFSIRLNYHLNILLNRNRHQFDQIAKIVNKHTHPLEYKGDNAKLTKQFSSNDLTAIGDVVDLINSRNSLQHIEFESYIIFFNTNFVKAQSRFNPVATLQNLNTNHNYSVVDVIGISTK